MKKKYNIQLNPKRLTDEEVARHKDFDAVLAKFRKQPIGPRPLYRQLTFWIAAVAVAAVFALLLIYTGTGNEKDYSQKMAEYIDRQPFVNCPLTKVEKRFASYRLDANKGGVFEHPSGSKLIVPEAAFSHQNGTTVEGEVTIKYREMHDFVDFFLSGIPMTYDSAGVQYTLESAGMIEIFAEQNGKRVNMAPGKSIDVELVSNVNVSPELNVPPGYNIYKLDEEKKNWVYQNIDVMEMLDDRFPQEAIDSDNPIFNVKQELSEKLQAIQVNEEIELAKVEASLPKAKRPEKPALANNTDYVFDLDFNDLKKSNVSGETADSQNELADLYRKYEKMLWQLSPDAGISPEQLQKGFSNVTDLAILKLDNNTYELTLKKGEEQLKVKVIPVLSGTDYQIALDVFNRDFQRYQQQISNRESALKVQKEEIRRKFEMDKQAANQTFDDRIADLKSKGMDYAAVDEIIKRKVVNRFTATGLGIWNCDRPIPPYIMSLAANFKDESGKSYVNKTAFLVDKSRNTVYRFLAEDGAELSFNMNSQNLLWLVTDDFKIAVFRPEDFKGIQKGTELKDFVMKKVDKEINDENDVREVLYL